MAAQGGPKSVAFLLLSINLLMYGIATIIAIWALNYGINETPRSVSGLTVPARIFPIYYPIGNLATGFFVIFSLIAGLVGVASCLTGLQGVLQGTTSSMLSAGASSIMAWSLTLLAMGLACKEISIGWRTSSLRALETLTIALSATQLLCAGTIHAGIPATLTPSYKRWKSLISPWIHHC